MRCGLSQTPALPEEPLVHSGQLLTSYPSVAPSCGVRNRLEYVGGTRESTLENDSCRSAAGEFGQCQIPPAETVGNPMTSGHRESLAAQQLPYSVHEHTAGFGLLLIACCHLFGPRNFWRGVHLWEPRRTRCASFHGAIPLPYLGAPPCHPR